MKSHRDCEHLCKVPSISVTMSPLVSSLPRHSRTGIPFREKEVHCPRSRGCRSLNVNRCYWLRTHTDTCTHTRTHTRVHTFPHYYLCTIRRWYPNATFKCRRGEGFSVPSPLYQYRKDTLQERSLVAAESERSRDAPGLRCEEGPRPRGRRTESLGVG